MRSLACLALLLVASSAHADDDRCRKDRTIDVTSHVEYRDGRRIIVIEPEIVMCLHAPRPSVAYVHTAKSINYEWATLGQDLLPIVLASVAKAPF